MAKKLNKARLGNYVSKALKERIINEAATKRQTISAAVEELLEEALDARYKKKESDNA